VLGSLGMSFTDMKQRDLRTPFAVNGVGFDNYVKALSDETFRKAAFNTAYFVVIGVPLRRARVTGVRSATAASRSRCSPVRSAGTVMVRTSERSSSSAMS